MKTHKKLSIAFTAAILAAAGLSAQEKVAVLPPHGGRNVTEINKKTVRSAFLDFISEHGSGFIAIDRQSIDTMIPRDPSGQPSMLYDEKVARDFGRKLGVPLVCIIDLTRDERDFLIECKLVRVDTSWAVSKSEVVSSLTNAELKRASEAIVRKLMAMEGTRAIASAPAPSAAVRTEPPSRAAAATAPTPSQAAAARPQPPSRAAAPPSHGYDLPNKRPMEPSKSMEPSDDVGWSFGVSLHAANPGGDLINKKKLGGHKIKTGFGLSAFGEFDLNDKMAIRGRVDYNLFGEDKIEDSDSYESYSHKYTDKLGASAMTLFADYIFRFDSHEKGPYAFAGLGFVNGKFKWEEKKEMTFGSVTRTDVDRDSLSGSNLGFSLGFGYNFTKNMGLEASYVNASNVIKPEGPIKPFGFSWMQASFKYRFGYGHVSKTAKQPQKSLESSYDGGWSYGLSLHLANPSGDLTIGTSVKMGLGLSAFAEFPLNDTMALRGRVDHNIFGEGKEKYSDYLGDATFTRKANATTVFADYIYSFDSHEKGPYAFAGLGFVSGKVTGGWEEVWSGGSGSGSLLAESGSNLGFSFGLGYNINRHMGLEASYVTASNVIKPVPEPGEPTMEYGFSWTQVSFKYRF